MQLTKWVHETIWISKVKYIHWPWSKVTQIQHFQTSFPEKPLDRLKANFMWSLNGMGEWKNIQMVQVTWPAARLIYGKNLKKIFFTGIKRPMTLKLSKQHWVLEYYQIYSNDDPGLTLTYFTTRSNLVPCAFVWEKGKTMDFSETIVVVCRCSELNVYMNLYAYTYQRSRSFFSSRNTRPIEAVEDHSVSTFSNFFFLETPRPIEAKFNVEFPWDGKTKAWTNGLRHMTKDANIW